MNSLESYTLLNSQGNRKSQWQVHVVRSASDIYGCGSESVVRPVDAVSANLSVPVVLKTYDEWYDVEVMERCSRNTELTNIFAGRQYYGYQLLRNANYTLQQYGDPGFPIVSVCRLATRDTDHRLALVQTDLTHTRSNILIEMKDLLDHTVPKSLFSGLFDQIRIPFTTLLYQSLVARALRDIEADMVRARQCGIVVRPPDPIPDYNITFAKEFPHQFSSWGMIITQQGEATTVLHDFSYIHTTGDTHFVPSAISRAKDIFAIQ